MRKISKYEIEIIENLAKYLIHHECQVIDIHPEDKNYHHVELVHPSEPWKGGGYSVLADYVSHDVDGAIISLIVLGDSSRRPYEIEIQRLDGFAIQNLPIFSSWKAVESGPD